MSYSPLEEDLWFRIINEYPELENDNQFFDVFNDFVDNLSDLINYPPRAIKPPILNGTTPGSRGPQERPFGEGIIRPDDIDKK